MALQTRTRARIKNLLLDKLNEKLDSHTAETEYKPFFQAIFNERQVVAASVIQSFYTSFGMSIYEQMAVMLAEGNGFQAERQHLLLGQIDKKTEALISQIHRNLRSGTVANSKEEVRLIRAAIAKGAPKKDPDSIIDLYLKAKNGHEYYFGITTVKPNKEGFETHKRKLLRWVGLRLSQDKSANISVATVIPYNPYYPKPYSRFASSTLFDKDQLLVQEAFWDFVGGEGAFDWLISICREVGLELRQKIDSL